MGKNNNAGSGGSGSVALGVFSVISVAKGVWVGGVFDDEANRGLVFRGRDKRITFHPVA